MTPVFRRGDDKAFERLYSRHVRDVYRYAAAMLDDAADAEDVTQTTFLNAYRSFNSGVRPERPRSWLLAIAHNVCRQRFRQAQRRPHEVAFDERVGDGQTTDEPTTPSIEDLRRALGQLPANQRTALVMRELEGGSYAEIAEVLGISVSALETLLFRARQALREQLEENLTCHDAALAIHRQLDGRLPNGEKSGLRAHLRACAECSSLAQSLRAQRRALKTLVLVPVPASVSHWFGHETAATATGASGAGGLTAAGAASGGGAGASTAVFAGAAAKIAAVVIAGVAIGGGTYTGVVIARHGGSTHLDPTGSRDDAAPTRGELVSARVRATPGARVGARATIAHRFAATTHAAGSSPSASRPGAASNVGSSQASDPATTAGGPPGDAPSAADQGGNAEQPAPPAQSGKSDRTVPPAHGAKDDQSAPPDHAASADQATTSNDSPNADGPAAGAASGDRPGPNQNANPRSSDKTVPPGKARSSAPVGQRSSTPPGQSNAAQNKAGQNNNGQNKSDGSRGQAAKPDAPPGQTKTDTPPGQTKPDATPGQTKPDNTPPGQTKTDTPPGQSDPGATPPGQSKADTSPPGQSKPDNTSPGQTKTDAPPGQTKPDNTPPGQQNRPDPPPGQANQNPPQTQDPAPQQQSQDSHSQGNKPPDPPGKK